MCLVVLLPLLGTTSTQHETIRKNSGITSQLYASQLGIWFTSRELRRTEQGLWRRTVGICLPAPTNGWRPSKQRLGLMVLYGCWTGIILSFNTIQHRHQSAAGLLALLEKATLMKIPCAINPMAESGEW